jgi:biotin transporter BioY
MKHNDMLKIVSLLSLLLLVVHLADDVVRGMFPPGIPLLYAAIFSGLLMYGTLVLAERRSGILIMLLVSLFAMAMPVLHTRGSGVAKSAQSSGGFFFIWTILALGALGTLSCILSLGELWNLRSRKPQ